MAVRAPTGFVVVDSGLLLPRKPVIVTGPDDTVDNQEFILDHEELVISCLHHYIDPGVPGAWLTIAHHYVTFPDRCGTATTKTGQFSVYLRCPGNNWQVALYNNYNLTRYGFNVAITAAPAWCGNTGSPGWTNIVLATDGSENDLELQVQRAGAGVGLEFYGLAVYV